MNISGSELANLLRSVSQQTSNAADKPGASQLQNMLSNAPPSQQAQASPGGPALQNILRQVSGLSNLDSSQLGILSDRDSTPIGSLTSTTTEN